MSNTELLRRYEREVLAVKSAAMQSAQAPQLTWWQGQLGNLHLDQVTPSRLAACRDELLSSGRSPATVNRYLSALSHASAVATREWAWLDENPMQKVARLPEPRGRVRMLDESERRWLLAACEASSNRYLYALVVLALSTTARKMELLTLTWGDVDLSRGRLILHQTKNKERHSLPLTGHAAKVVQALSKVRRIDTALLFPRPDGKAPTDIRYAWQQALGAAGIDDFRFHDLRHSAASYLAMNGASLLEIAAVLGHKTLSMVQRYSHLTEGHTAAVVGRMNRAIFK